MREYNADPSRPVPLRFYGFDSPTEMMNTESPRQLLEFVLDYLAPIDGAAGRERRERIEALLGPDADWENPAAMMDPAQSVGLSPAATALRIETEDLIADLRVRRPELAANGRRGPLPGGGALRLGRAAAAELPRRGGDAGRERTDRRGSSACATR